MLNDFFSFIPQKNKNNLNPNSKINNRLWEYDQFLLVTSHVTQLC